MVVLRSRLVMEVVGRGGCCQMVAHWQPAVEVVGNCRFVVECWMLVMVVLCCNWLSSGK